MQSKHLSFQQELQFAEYFLQHLHFNLPQNVQSFNNGKTSLIKSLYSFINSFSSPKMNSIPKKKKKFFLKKSLKKLLI